MAINVTTVIYKIVPAALWQEAQARDRIAAQRKPLETRLRRVESEMEKLTSEKGRLETLLADPNLYAADKRDAMKAALLEQSGVNARLRVVEEEWLRLHTELEAL